MNEIESQRQESTRLEELKEMKNYAEEPVFAKKAEKAKDFIKKYGLPDSVIKEKIKTSKI